LSKVFGGLEWRIGVEDWWSEDNGLGKQKGKISLTTMWDAERQSYLFFATIVAHDHDEHAYSEFREDLPNHPFFQFMRGQSISSLACGLIYMLHAAILIDVKLTSRFNDHGRHAPIPLFVLGRAFHQKLNSYQWFREFCESNTIDI